MPARAWRTELAAIALGSCALVASGCGESEPPAAAAAAKPSRPASADPYPMMLPVGGEVDCGHVRFRLLAARIDRVDSERDGEPKTLSVRVSLQATELASVDTSVAGEQIRLQAGGRAYPPRSAPNVQLWASQTVDVGDLTFVVPAPLTTASLQLATADGASALLPLRLTK